MRPLNLIWKEVVVMDVGNTKNNPPVVRMSRPTMGALYSLGAQCDGCDGLLMIP